jgi:hypothetical protein
MFYVKKEIMYGEEDESNSINVSDITSMQMPSYYVLIHF